MILRLTFIALAFLLLSRCVPVPLTSEHQLILFPEGSNGIHEFNLVQQFPERK